jgi:hypothetical protein
MWSGVSQDQALLIMDEFFDLDDGAWVHARCQVVIDAYLKRQEDGSKGGKKRAANAASKKQVKGKSTSSTLQATINHKPITNKKKTTTTSSKPAASTKAPGKVPIQEIVDKWNVFAAMHRIPQVVKRTKALEGQIRQRWNDIPSMDKWNNFFDYIGLNDFLAGRTEPGPGRSKPFRATLLWVTKETNFAKITAKEFD